MKVRYYILIAFYTFCAFTYYIAIRIKDMLYILSRPKTGLEEFEFIFFGFIQMVYLLIFLWIVVTSLGLFYFKKRKLEEYFEGFKYSLVSVIIVGIIFSVILFLEL